jgi:hypothetical protein
MGEVFVAIVAMAVSGIIWGVRQEGRANTLAQRVIDNEQREVLRVENLKELFNSRFDDLDSRLERIERGMNGYLHGGRHG